MVRARATLLLLCLALTGTPVAAQSKGKNGPSPAPAQTQPTDPVALGRAYLKLGDLDRARTNCEAAIATKPSEAESCLEDLVKAEYEAKLRDFESSVDLGKRDDAIKAAQAVREEALSDEQKNGSTRRGTSCGS